jgi:hypothetical protein
MQRVFLQRIVCHSLHRSCVQHTDKGTFVVAQRCFMELIGEALLQRLIDEEILALSTPAAVRFYVKRKI